MILRGALEGDVISIIGEFKKASQVSVKLKARLTYWIELRNTMLLWMRFPA